MLKALKKAGKSTGGRSDSGFAGEILQSLGQIAPVASLSQPAADEVIEAVAAYLEAPQNFMRITAAKALGDFGLRATLALPKLRALAENESASAAAREAASDAIAKIEPEKEKATEKGKEKEKEKEKEKKPDSA